MSQTFRHPDILEIARREGKVTVEQLAEHFGVTLQTIRRDLTELAEANKLERVHGGAILPSGTTNIEYEERRNLNETAKLAIARACAAHIPEGCSVFLNIGTSTEAVARQLLRHQDLLLVTNNMNVAQIFSENTHSKTIVTGGALRRTDNGLVGTVAIDTIRQFKFDISVIGCSAMDHDGDLLDFDVEEVAVSQTIIAQSRKCFLVADASKFSRTAPARIASLQSMDTVFTDQPFPADLTARCRSWNTEIVVAT
jgi:DeoR family glycerol-3-phosphate regulon repressor